MIVILDSATPHTGPQHRAAQLRVAQLRESLAGDTRVSLPSGETPGALRLAMQAAAQDIQASDDDLALINERHSGLALTADDVVVFQDYALHNQRLTHRSLQFTRGALNTLAARARDGRSVIRDHMWRDLIGSVFDADVVEATVRGVVAPDGGAVAWLRLRWYAVLTDDTSPERRSLIQDCRTGVLRFGSVGVIGGSWDFQEIETENGWDYWYLIDDDGSDGQPGSLDLQEYSRTVMGAAQGAGDHKFSGQADSLDSPQPAPRREAPSKT
ncbi:MAG: hypothetical protein AAFN13_18345, partial [Bacteroidota bacterium]